MKYIPAFPRPASEFTKHGSMPDGNDAVDAQEGMSLRDYFAAKAMAAFIPLGATGQVDDFHSAEIARESYLYADAMLAERMKGGAK